MNNLGKRRALLTGATGYIGSQLARRLMADGWEVHAIVRPGSNLEVLEPLLPSIVLHKFGGSTQEMLDIVEAAAPDAVFHLASLFLAQHKPEDIVALINSNLLFSTQLAEAMVAHGVRLLVNTGTAWQHYRDAAVNPVNLYAATKQAFEDVLAYYVEAHGLKVTTLVLFDTYGPRDPRPKLIALLWKAATSQQQLEMSPGEQLIDLVHIADVVNAFALAEMALRSQDAGHTRYGVSSGKPLALKELVSVFERATGTRLPILWGGRPYRPREVMTPWTRPVPVPGWQPEVSLEAGLVQTSPASTPADGTAQR